MALGGGKIAGHSGTDFKHRKAFVNGFRSPVPSVRRTIYREEVYFKHDGFHEYIWKSLKFFGLIGLIGVSLFVGRIFLESCAFDVVHKVDTGPNYFQYLEETKHLEWSLFLARSGEEAFVKGDLDLAQREFVAAIALDNNNVSAYTGLIEVCILKCNDQNIYCDRAQKYLSALCRMKTTVSTSLQTVLEDKLQRALN